MLSFLKSVLGGAAGVDSQEDPATSGGDPRHGSRGEGVPQGDQRQQQYVEELVRAALLREEKKKEKQRRLEERCRREILEAETERQERQRRKAEEDEEEKKEKLQADGGEMPERDPGRGDGETRKAKEESRRR